MFKKKYYVEKNIPLEGWPSNWMTVGEFDTTREIADKIGYSPAKLNNFIKQCKSNELNKIPNSDYRVYINE